MTIQARLRKLLDRVFTRTTKRYSNQKFSRQLRLELLEERKVFAVVTTSSDVVDINDDFLSLREAVEIAAPGETITFAASLNGQTIALRKFDPNNQPLGEIAFAKNLTIDASDLPLGITIDAGTILGDQTPGVKNGDGMGIFRILAGNVTLQNLTLQGADVSSQGGAISAFGDVYLKLDTVTIRDSAVPSGYSGGGLYFQTPQTLTFSEMPARLVVQDCVFQNNSAGDGGGVFVDLGSGAGSEHVQALGQRAEINRTKFLSNTALKNGGAIAARLGAGGELSIAESTISGNVAGEAQENGITPGELNDAGGGLYCYMFSGDDGRNFSYNQPTEGDPSKTQNGIAKVTITGSTIDNNTAGSYGGGVAICAKRQDYSDWVRSRLGIVNTTISGNTVLRNQTSPNYPGVLGKGGGVALAVFPPDDHEGLDTHFQNATLTENLAEEGGAIWSMIPSQPTSQVRTWLTNTIVSANTKRDGTTPDNLNGSFDVERTVFNLIGTGNSIVDYDTHMFPVNSTSPPYTVNSDGLRNDTAGGNLLNNNTPGLASLASNGGPTRTHALQSTSPAIDRGRNLLAIKPFTSSTLANPNGTPLDNDQRGVGAPRIFNVLSVPESNANDFDYVDMGAYESAPSTTLGDYDRDQDVDCDDYWFWRSTFNSTVDAYAGADGNGDGKIDAADYTIWADQFFLLTGGLLGDFNDDLVVDLLDYKIWNDSFGQTGAMLAADANCNGVVDAADYTIWRDTVFSTPTAARYGLLGVVVR